MSQITSLVCVDDFKETNEMQKSALWHSELELMPFTEIYSCIWGKKEVFPFSVLDEATATLIDRLIKGCGCWLQNSAFLGGEKRKEKTFSGGEGECKHFGVLYYILLFLVKPSSFLFYS